MEFSVDFITKEGNSYSIETEKLNIPAIDGRRTILSNHMPILVPIENGVIETSLNDKLDHYVVDEGVVYFKENHAKVLIGHVVPVKDIQIENIKKEASDLKETIKTQENQYRLEEEKKQLAWYNTLIKAYERYFKS